MAAAFSELEELQVGFNEWRLRPSTQDAQDLAGLSCKMQRLFPKLECLNLEHNAIDDWGYVDAYFGGLSRLKTILLNHNPIAVIQPRGSGTDVESGTSVHRFAALSTLQVVGCGLDTWQSMDAMYTYDTLTTLRLKNIPLFKGIAETH